MHFGIYMTKVKAPAWASPSLYPHAAGGNEGVEPPSGLDIRGLQVQIALRQHDVCAARTVQGGRSAGRDEHLTYEV